MRQASSELVFVARVMTAIRIPKKKKKKKKKNKGIANGLKTIKRKKSGLGGGGW